MDTTIALPRFRQFPDVTLPDGWLLNEEAKLLYTTASLLPDGAAVLEFGSWIGRSTCSIAYGIRDGGRQIRFDIVDYGIAGAGEWRSRFAQEIHDHPDAARLRPVIETVGGSAALLKQHLVDRDLGSYISLMVLGDIEHYETRRRYDFIYCDAAHDIEETRRNIPHVARLLADECILICDDMHGLDQIAYIREAVEADGFYYMRALDDCSRMAIFTRGDRFRDYLA